MDLLYFRFTDEELLIEAQMEAPMIDPRIWTEARRRGIESRLYTLLSEAAQ